MDLMKCTCLVQDQIMCTMENIHMYALANQPSSNQYSWNLNNYGQDLNICIIQISSPFIIFFSITFTFSVKSSKDGSPYICFFFFCFSNFEFNSSWSNAINYPCSPMVVVIIVLNLHHLHTSIGIFHEFNIDIRGCINISMKHKI